MQQPCHLLNLLLVEDDDDHVALFHRMMHESQLANHLDRVADGEAALAYLHARGAYARRRWPDIVLLDLKLPRKDGHEVLHAIKQSPVLCGLSVIILTTSDSETDHVRTYLSHADGYLVKPLTQQSFLSLTRSLGFTWAVLRPAVA